MTTITESFMYYDGMPQCLFLEEDGYNMIAVAIPTVKPSYFAVYVRQIVWKRFLNSEVDLLELFSDGVYYHTFYLDDIKTSDNTQYVSTKPASKEMIANKEFWPEAGFFFLDLAT